jgi:arabinogalactan endo-1,4-beta-galactosidase
MPLVMPHPGQAKSVVENKGQTGNMVILEGSKNLKKKVPIANRAKPKTAKILSAFETFDRFIGNTMLRVPYF